MKPNANLFLNDKVCSKSGMKKALEMGLNFIRSKNIKKPVIDFENQNKIWERIHENIPQKGKEIDNVLKEFQDKILKNSVNFSNPQYMGFPDCGISNASQIGNILSSLINQNMINSITASPTATFVDILLIQWMRKLLGYKNKKNLKGIYDIGGITTIGGVAANTTGILLAREFAKKRYKTNCVNNFRIFVGKGIGHYSIERASFWLGLSPKSLIEVNLDKNFCLDVNDLELKIKDELKKGKIPIAVVAYAGNSLTMSIDNLKKIYKVSKKYKTWVHVDACHGFSLAFSRKLKSKIRGIQFVDSITLDPHKVLFIPYNLSYLLVKDPNNMKLITKKGNIVLTEPFSMGAMTPFIGSFAFNSLKFWFLIKNLGKIKIGKLIEERHDLVRWFAKVLEKEGNFITLNDITINSCVFYFFPKNEKSKITKNEIMKYNKLNYKIFQRLFKEGNYYIHSFKISDEGHRISNKTKYKVQCLRIMPGNPLTTKKTLRNLIINIKRIANESFKDET